MFDVWSVDVCCMVLFFFIGLFVKIDYNKFMFRVVFNRIDVFVVVNFEVGIIFCVDCSCD